LQPQALNRGLAEYREYGYRSDGRMLRALRALAATPRAAVELAKLARAQAVPWASLPPHLTPVVWVHGLICERGHDACFRSPFVREMATLALGRLSRTAVFVRGYLPQDRLIPERLRKARARLTRRLTSAAFRGKLLWVYYGEVVDVDGEEVKLQLTAENAESFECVMSRAHLGLPVTPHTGFLKYAWLSKKGPREAYEFYAADDDSAT
jgi:hypothetical protein